MLRAAEPADAMGIATVQVTAWRSAYRGLLPADYLAGMDAGEAASRWERRLRTPDPLVFVAESEAGLVGFASGGPEREGDPVYRGELYAIYLLPQHQGLGHGRALAAAVAAGLADRRMRSMLVWVLRDNGPARAFYERLGGAYVREHPLEIGGATVAEVSYGWRDTVSLRGSEAG